MPEPLLILLVTAAGTAGAEGIRRAYKANENTKQIKSIAKDIQSQVSLNKSKLENKKNATTNQLANLGRVKFDIMSSSMKKFIEEYKKIKKVNFKKIDLQELDDFKPEDPEIKNLDEATINAKNIAVKGIGSLGTGTLVSVAAYGTVMYGGFAAASTGTMIATLHGAAATNATLAWLGGGSLAAGGCGMAGGMVVLGGLVVGPALLVGGWMLEKETKKKLYEALEKKDEAEKFEKQVDRMSKELQAIGDRSQQILKILTDLNKLFVEQIENLVRVISFSGNDFSKYSKTEQKVVILSAMLAKTIKIILGVHLLKENGTLTDESRNIVCVYDNVKSYDINNLRYCMQKVEGNNQDKNSNDNIIDTFQEGMKYYQDKKFDDAVKYFRDAAKKGNIEAQYKIGLCYENGEGVRQHYEMAKYWYGRAAEEGHPLAVERLNHLNKGKEL